MLSYIATPIEVVDRKILAVKKSMADEIFYEGKPFFYKATQNIKCAGDWMPAYKQAPTTTQ